MEAMYQIAVITVQNLRNRQVGKKGMRDPLALTFRAIVNFLNEVRYLDSTGAQKKCIRDFVKELEKLV